MYRTLHSFLAAIAFSVSGALAEPISVTSWNVEDFDFGGSNAGSGSDGAEIAVQLRDDFNEIDIFALQEVHSESVMEVYAVIAALDEVAPYQYVYGNTGNSIRLGMLINTGKFDVQSIEELDFGLSSSGTRFPLAVLLASKSTNQQFYVVNNHSARNNEAARVTQSENLQQWASQQSVPVLAIGDFNFDYNIVTDDRHPAYDALVEGAYFKWIEPDLRIDTSWSGGNQDSYPDQILDFVFAGGTAKGWQSRSLVYKRAGDFPDNGDFADHRPVVAFFETDANASFAPNVSKALPRLQTETARLNTLRAGIPAMVRMSASQESITAARAPAALKEQVIEKKALGGSVAKVAEPDDLLGIPRHLWPYVRLGDTSFAQIVRDNPNLFSGYSGGQTGYYLPGTDPSIFPPWVLPYINQGNPGGMIDGFDGR